MVSLKVIYLSDDAIIPNNKLLDLWQHEKIITNKWVVGNEIFTFAFVVLFAT